MIVNETLELNRLYDYYGNLLTTRQREVFKYYYHEDFSYQEIAELLEISRAGVYDTLKRAKNALENYEEKLKLKKRLDKMFKSLEGLNNHQVNQIIEEFYNGGRK